MIILIMGNVKVKICCIKSEAEAQLAISYGADAIGLVGPMPSGPGIITNDEIKRISMVVPDHIMTFMLTSETTVAGIIDHHHCTMTNTIQIVDELKEGSLDDLKSALPEVNLVQVVHVIDQHSVDYAMTVAQSVDYLLLDSGNPNLKIKELGGTGRVHNWRISKEIVRHSPIPVFLAGGLNESNVAKAIKEVSPYGLDLCSGVRTDDRLDQQKLKKFFSNAHVYAPK